MNAPPNQPPGGRPPGGPGQPQMNFDPETGQPIQQPQPAQPQPQAPAQPQPQAPAQPQPQAPMQPAPQAPMQPQQPQAPVPQQPQYQQPMAPAQPKPDETLAWVSAGLAAAAWFLGLNIFTGIPAIIVGMMAKKKIKKEPDKYGGGTMATVGIVGGAVMTGLVVIGTVVALLMMFLPVCVGCLGAIAGSI